MTTTRPAHVETSPTDLTDHARSSATGPEAATGAATGDVSEPVIVAGRDSDGGRLPGLRERMSPPMPSDRLIGWIGPLLVTLLAGVIRFVGLGRPAKFVFDETYYPKDAFGLLRFGVEHAWLDGAEQLVLSGHYTLFQVFGAPAFVVHPPAGKWAMALGEWVLGMNPFGWRSAVALMGTLSVLVMARLVRRLTRSTLLGCVAGLLLALDGLHFVESRIALIDLPAMFWMVLGLACLLIDRDWARRRLADAAEAERVGRVAGWGPSLLWRPWRLVAGVCLGLACATKWNAAFVLAILGLSTWLWDLGARRAIGVRLTRAYALKRLVVDTAVAMVTVVGSAVVVYVTSWVGWFASSDGYDRQWASTHPAKGLAALVPDAVRSLWHYHAEIMHFHTTLTGTHPYASNPWGWLIISRPVSFDFVDNIGPEHGCPQKRCIQEILGIGTPVIWWAAVIALIACVVFWIGSRDWRFGIPVLGVAATWLPWMHWAGRPIFYFYAIAILPFLVIGLTLVLGRVLGPRDARPERRMWGAALLGGFLLLVVLNFAYLYPILTDQTIPYGDWLARMWFGSWV